MTFATLKRISAIRNEKRSRLTGIDESGINMVDLMMWLVIAALLLSAALQGIGYYQKAAFIYQMKSDVDGVATVVLAQASMSGSIGPDELDYAIANANHTQGTDIHWETAAASSLLSASGVPTADGSSSGFERVSFTTGTAAAAGQVYVLVVTHPNVPNVAVKKVIDPYSAATSSTGSETQVVDTTSTPTADPSGTPTADPSGTPTPDPSGTPTPDPSGTPTPDPSSSDQPLPPPPPPAGQGPAPLPPPSGGEPTPAPSPSSSPSHTTYINDVAAVRDWQDAYFRANGHYASITVDPANGIDTTNGTLVLQTPRDTVSTRYSSDTTWFVVVRNMSLIESGQRGLFYAGSKDDSCLTFNSNEASNWVQATPYKDEAELQSSFAAFGCTYSG